MSRVLATVLLLLCAPISVQAQAYPIDGGSLLIDGSVSYSDETTETPQFESTTNLLSLAPTVHYFVAPGLAFGVTLLLTDGENETIRPEFTSRVEFEERAVGPSVRYYFGSANSTWLPVLSVSYTFGSRELNGGAGGSELSTSTLEGAAGVLLLLNRHVGITGEVYLQDGTMEVEGEPDADRRTSGFRVGIATFVF